MAGNTQKPKRSRCPNGTHKNPKTGKCEPKKSSVKNNKANNVKSEKTKKVKIAFKKVSKKAVKPSAKQQAHAKLMRKELLELSGPYQEHKKEQVVKKALAKKIKTDNLRYAKDKLKKTKKN